MELCVGGELMGFILRAFILTELQVSIVVRQVLNALCHIHNHDICHRDVKSSNILLLTGAPLQGNTVKLVDFGLARRIEPGESIRDFVGTAQYVAPEVINGQSNQSADIWSCGVVTYELLCGVTPFHLDTEASTLACVRRGNFVFGAEDWRQVSDTSKDFIRSLLKMDTTQRLTAVQAFSHNWLCGGASIAALSWPRHMKYAMENKIREADMRNHNDAKADFENISMWRKRLTHELNNYDVLRTIGCEQPPCRTPLGCCQQVPKVSNRADAC